MKRNRINKGTSQARKWLATSRVHKSWPWSTHSLGLVLAFIGLLWSVTTVPAQDGKVVQVGAVKSLFRDMSEAKIKELTVPFGELMLKHTGLNGQVTTGADAAKLADQLNNGKIDLGLFHGYEFAWAKQKFPKLKPLMVAVNKKPYLSIHLVARSDSKITKFDDLKDKTVSLPASSREHCYLYVDQHCEKLGTTPEKFFGKLVKPESIEDALDDVVRKTVAAAIVDSLSLESYEIVKPGAFALLKSVEKSEPFPPSVVAYSEGKLDQQTLDTFRKGMLNANKDPKSRGQMSLWKVTAFEQVPANFQPALEKIRKAYPAPAGW